MSHAAAWLRRRRPSGPDSLESSMADAVEASEAAGAAAAGALAGAALTTLRSVVARPSTRSGALALLTVDALVTHACEAAAEEGEAPLRELLASLTPERFGGLFEAPEAR